MLLLSPPNYRIEDHLDPKFVWKYTPRSTEELNKLARDIVGNRVFLDTMIHNPRDMGMVFIPLVLSSGRDIRFLQWTGAHLLYEYWSEASPRSINGYPCFFSFRYLNKSDTDRLFAIVKRLRTAIETALHEPPESPSDASNG